jgi:Na+-driven multidrug efflux pump
VCVSVIRPIMASLAVNVFHLSLALTWLASLAEIGIRLVFFYQRFESGEWAFKKV